MFLRLSEYGTKFDHNRKLKITVLQDYHDIDGYYHDSDFIRFKVGYVITLASYISTKVTAWQITSL